jgi:hypothetical protein
MSSLAAGKSLGFYPPFFLCTVKGDEYVHCNISEWSFPGA